MCTVSVPGTVAGIRFAGAAGHYGKHTSEIRTHYEEYSTLGIYTFRARLSAKMRWLVSILLVNLPVISTI
jgi:hypothetical protein